MSLLNQQGTILFDLIATHYPITMFETTGCFDLVDYSEPGVLNHLGVCNRRHGLTVERPSPSGNSNRVFYTVKMLRNKSP